MGEQTAIGFFKRWVRGTALCRIPFYDNFRKLFNILETIEGRNGIKILKPTGNDGFGWTITKDKSDPDGISLENNADGKPQIMEWDGKENVTASGISECLKADPETGVITAKGSADTYELLVRVGGAGGPVGYMPIGEGDGSDPEDPNADGCDQNTHPASGGGGGGEEEDDDHPQDQDEEHPGEGDNGTGGDTGDTQHPASDDCYTTAY